MSAEPTSLSPTGTETGFALAALVAVVFAGYAAHQVRRGGWPIGFALTLALLTFVIPLAGPVVLMARGLWRRAR